MKKNSKLFFFTLSMLSLSQPLFGSSFRINGKLGEITLDTAIAGQNPSPRTDDSTSYSIKVDGKNASITASLQSSLPKNTKLTVEFEAPSGAVSLGPVSLDETEQVLVRNISKGMYRNLQITYTFSADVSAGAIVAANEAITYKLIDND